MHKVKQAIIMAAGLGKRMRPDVYKRQEEVIAYLEKLRLLIQYLGASDCKLQEGSIDVYKRQALWYGHTGDRPYHVLCALRVHYCLLYTSRCDYQRCTEER